MPTTRYEIKLVTQEVELPQVRSWIRLHPDDFSQPFPNRQINNLYFDTPHLDSYSENLAGVSDRRKLRLRWYGCDLANIQGILELKCKRSAQGWKQSQKLHPPLDLTATAWVNLRNRIRPELQPSLREYFERYSWPILLNHYQREYYLSFDGHVRITLDYAITSYDQRMTHRPNLQRPLLPNGKMVVEVKADRNHQHRLSEAIAHLPLRVGKHSKYATAMEALLG